MAKPTKNPKYTTDTIIYDSNEKAVTTKGHPLSLLPFSIVM